MKFLKSGALKIEVYFIRQPMNLLLSSRAADSFVSTELCVDDCHTTNKLRASHKIKWMSGYPAFDNEYLESDIYAIYGDYASMLITNFQEDD